MPTIAHRIADWRFAPEDRLFFDTNVWMLLLGVQGDPTDAAVAVYSAAFKRALQAQSQIFTDVLVLAEFSNAALRVEHELAIRFSDAPTDFKTFRDQSDEYGYAVQNIATHLQSIRKYATCLPCNAPDWTTFLARFGQGKRDFNDELIVLQCQQSQLILVTHDRDFAGADLEILTHRSTYFSRRR